MTGLRFFKPSAGSETDAVFGFYQSLQTEFLWPRTIDEIRSMSADGQLFAAADDGILACCYMKPLTSGDLTDVLRRINIDEDAYEFGGVLVSPAARKKKIGSTLGRTSLAAVSAMSTPGAVIAHVHENSDLPRALLTALGFNMTGVRRMAHHSSLQE